MNGNDIQISYHLKNRNKWSCIKTPVVLEVAWDHSFYHSLVIWEVSLPFSTVYSDRVEVMNDGCFFFVSEGSNVRFGSPNIDEDLPPVSVLQDSDELRPSIRNSVVESSWALVSVFKLYLLIQRYEFHKFHKICINIRKIASSLSLFHWIKNIVSRLIFTQIGVWVQVDSNLCWVWVLILLISPAKFFSNLHKTCFTITVWNLHIQWLVGANYQSLTYCSYSFMIVAYWSNIDRVCIWNGCW